MTWLLGYMGELGCRYKELSERERLKEADTMRKIGKYQESLEKLSK
jgi:hypothetical protein